jgi:hypothetical protein
MARRAGRMRVVENFTETVNVEHAVAAGCAKCLICDELFANKESTGLERPVETVCNHIIGKHCLQEWRSTITARDEQDNTSCPQSHEVVYRLVSRQD